MKNIEISFENGTSTSGDLNGASTDNQIYVKIRIRNKI